jgi:hypothetical protein
LPLLRRKQPQAANFRLPGGMIFALLALIFSAVLVTRMHGGELVAVSATFALGALNWFLARRRLRSALGIAAES